MSVIDVVILSAVGAIVGFVWIMLIRASVRRGCRSGSCRFDASEDEEQTAQRTDG